MTISNIDPKPNLAAPAPAASVPMYGCGHCGAEWPHDHEFEACPQCGSPDPFEYNATPAEAAAKSEISNPQISNSDSLRSSRLCGSTAVAVSTWIPVTRELPDDEITVLFYRSDLGDTNYDIGFHLAGHWYDQCGHILDPLQPVVTHWQHLPAPPL